MEYTHLFQDNETVEINEGGHFGTFYKAEIVGRIGAEQDYMYRVNCLCRKDANGMALVHNVHISRIRPMPGKLDETTKAWEVDDIVDAFDSSNGAWRAGILTKIDRVPVTRFTVKLSDQTEMSTQSLRYHSDWIPRPCYVFYRQKVEVIANGNGYHHDDPQDIEPPEIDPQEIDPLEEIDPQEMEPQEVDPLAILLQVIDPPGNGHHHNDNQENEPPGIGHQNGHQNGH
ncbi:uncharacterized protein LOC126665053 [Mercurialis annua]|uniref:uncharacterized protein LOC126665053 n=1 Tax=Mercurialis annua TaxID=3986 RepID=UPI00215FF4B8|nr:uncharacterized protein LOC126665053 [Mercurialis annua]